MAKVSINSCLFLSSPHVHLAKLCDTTARELHLLNDFPQRLTFGKMHHNLGKVIYLQQKVAFLDLCATENVHVQY